MSIVKTEGQKMGRWLVLGEVIEEIAELAFRAGCLFGPPALFILAVALSF